MKIGDLIKADCAACVDEPGCACFFCAHDSNRIGLVIERVNTEVKHSSGFWSVMFDVGEWRLYGTEIEVISESR